MFPKVFLKTWIYNICIPPRMAKFVIFLLYFLIHKPRLEGAGDGSLVFLLWQFTAHAARNSLNIIKY